MLESIAMQFRLRTLLAVVTLAAVLTWVALLAPVVAVTFVVGVVCLTVLSLPILVTLWREWLTEKQDVSSAVMTRPNRRWFRFSLRTLFVAVTVCGTAGYWLVRYTAAQTAYDEYQRTYMAWEAETATTYQVCDASLNLLNAEVSVPLANHTKAAATHLDRIERIRLRVGRTACTFSDLGAREFAAHLTRIDQYYADARRRAAE